eukprot:COSAG01_NODE_559_length_15469_cov_11.071308_8_plen_102_part_00
MWAGCAIATATDTLVIAVVDHRLSRVCRVLACSQWSSVAERARGLAVTAAQRSQTTTRGGADPLARPIEMPGTPGQSPGQSPPGGHTVTSFFSVSTQPMLV